MTYKTTADSKGKFSLKVGYPKANTLIQVKATNSKGYYSKTEKIKVFTPSVSLYYDDIGVNSTKIIGQVSNQVSTDYVEVKIGSKTYK